MPTPLTHAVVGASMAQLAPNMPHRGKVAAVLALIATLPDGDLLFHEIGFHYGHVLSHRGLTHSMLFAALTAVLATWVISHRDKNSDRWMLVLALAASTSHPILDAMTDGGLGIGLFMPLVADRVFLPWRPIQVSPLRIATFATSAAEVLRSEILWVWLPLGAGLTILRGLSHLLRAAVVRSRVDLHREHGKP